MGAVPLLSSIAGAGGLTGASLGGMAKNAFSGALSSSPFMKAINAANGALSPTFSNGKADSIFKTDELLGKTAADTSADTGGPKTPTIADAAMGSAFDNPAVKSPGASAATGGTQVADASNNAFMMDPTARAKLPAGMRNNNPGNIKYVGQKDSSGPSRNTDQGDPQAMYDTPEKGMQAMYGLLSRKYAGGKTTPLKMIAGDNGWTPGNTQAAQNVANYSGIGLNDDINMSDPKQAAKFMRGLMLQEHGSASKLYSDDMISKAITSSPAPAQNVGGAPSAAAPAAPQFQGDPMDRVLAAGSDEGIAGIISALRGGSQPTASPVANTDGSEPGVTDRLLKPNGQARAYGQSGAQAAPTGATAAVDLGEQEVAQLQQNLAAKSAAPTKGQDRKQYLTNATRYKKA